MRLLVRLRSRADTAYDTSYHHKLRGRLWRALEGTEFGEMHDDNEPKPFTYSNPFPPRDMDEGDERTLLVSSTNEQLLAQIASDLLDDRELNIGEMPFHVEEVSSIDPDVGEPGTVGTLESGTGVLIRIPPWRFDEYDIDVNSEQSEFWRPEYSMKPFINQVEANLDRKHGLYCPEYLPGPSAVDGDLFDGYELIKTFAIPVTPTEGERETWVLSKWKLDYTVRDDHHRRHLNLALDVGIGERNSLGFGFVNVQEKSRPGAAIQEEANAHT